MEVKFNVVGKERKELVKAIESVAQEKSKYLGMPSATYEIGNFIVDKEGTVKCDDDFALERLVHNLMEDGFVPEKEGERKANVGLTVAIPLENVLVENLTKLLETKETLIKKALGIENIRIEVDPDKVSFPWFSKVPDPETCKAYHKFIAALCKMSKEQKRINTTEKEVTNEKYSFRCFLLRLGFIGDEYKSDRKILLKNLNGSSAFKSGAGKETRNDEVSK